MSDTKPAPLKISCTDSDCEQGLHCFKFHSRKMAASDRGKCRSCGADLVDWERVHRRDRADVAHTFAALKRELIRHHTWHVVIDDKAMAHARRKGMAGLLVAARHRLMKSLAPAEPVRDGQQTPFSGNAIYLAQHATACCCRTCLEYWHAIPKGQSLTAEEVEYAYGLVEAYLRERLPDLKEEPEKVRRHSRRGDAPRLADEGRVPT
ncbi:MAG TPA: DUF4186 family protein [Stellaceae bacterium]|nr:DUF4186 family protein [Stellaceae bacterium]